MVSGSGTVCACMVSCFEPEDACLRRSWFAPAQTGSGIWCGLCMRRNLKGPVSARTSMGIELCSTLSIEGIPYENEALNGVTHEFRGWMVRDIQLCSINRPDF